ncbi:hypothetical protein GUJ93_ZPchr0001g30623 [Zizania palustris]|uniref:Uncharacterized protein n=1 Tax=Zizania palustris TaxID=103762 RepID=A0A8J5V656_ZIZPA|nr:hypothetical protein GUJ93_ZPchr0001g30623 [Zizania palustris]
MPRTCRAPAALSHHRPAEAAEVGAKRRPSVPGGGGSRRGEAAGGVSGRRGEAAGGVGDRRGRAEASDRRCRAGEGSDRLAEAAAVERSLGLGFPDG